MNHISAIDLGKVINELNRLSRLFKDLSIEHFDYIDELSNYIDYRSMISY